MKFKVGDIILNRLGSRPDEEVDCEAIILKHWESPSPFRVGNIDNVLVYMTLDLSFPSACGKTDLLKNFKDDKWELKK